MPFHRLKEDRGRRIAFDHRREECPPDPSPLMLWVNNELGQGGMKRIIAESAREPEEIACPIGGVYDKGGAR